MSACARPQKHAIGRSSVCAINGRHPTTCSGIYLHTIVNHILTTAFTLFIALSCCTSSAFAADSPTDNDPLDKATRYAWELGLQSLINAEQASRNLSGQLELFLAEPSEAGLAQLRQEWRNCHQQWQQHAVWVELAQGQARRLAALNRRYFSIDARELQPGYLDAVQDYPFSGIVNDISIVLTADNLRQQHGLTDPSEVSLGFHALEFLLWGEQGQRPFTDFVPITTINAEQNAAGLTTGDLPNNRRRIVLRLINQVLADDLQRLRQDWQNPLSTISQSYLKLSPQVRLALIHGTAHQLLAVALPDQLLRAVTNDRAMHHNQFAGDTLQHSLALLSGLEALLTQGESPLVNHLLMADAGLEWQQQLRNLIAGLNELTQEKDNINSTKLASLLEQLPHLANALGTANLGAE